jgi:hypothetical protein
LECAVLTLILLMLNMVVFGGDSFVFPFFAHFVGSETVGLGWVEDF